MGFRSVYTFSVYDIFDIGFFIDQGFVGVEFGIVFENRTEGDAGVVRPLCVKRGLALAVYSSDTSDRKHFIPVGSTLGFPKPIPFVRRCPLRLCMLRPYPAIKHV